MTVRWSNHQALRIALTPSCACWRGICTSFAVPTPGNFRQQNSGWVPSAGVLVNAAAKLFGRENSPAEKTRWDSGPVFLERQNLCQNDILQSVPSPLVWA
jgi:hypothetical protein